MRRGLLGALSGLAAADAVQRGVVHEVLGEREILVERARLEDDAETLQGRARLAAHVVAQNADLAGDVVVEARDEREQRRLAGAVEAEQDAEGAARHGQRHVVEREVVAEAVAHAVDDQRVGCGLGLIWRGLVHLTMNFPVKPFGLKVPAAPGVLARLDGDEEKLCFAFLLHLDLLQRGGLDLHLVDLDLADEDVVKECRRQQRALVLAG